MDTVGGKCMDKKYNQNVTRKISRACSLGDWGVDEKVLWRLVYVEKI